MSSQPFAAPLAFFEPTWHYSNYTKVVARVRMPFTTRSGGVLRKKRILYGVWISLYIAGKTKYRILSVRFIDLAPAAPVRENSRIDVQTMLRENYMILTPQLQNSPERVTALSFTPGADFAIAVALRRMATANGVTPFYLLAPEVNALLHYMPDRRHHFLFSTLWNTGARIGEACTLTPESFELDGPVRAHSVGENEEPARAPVQRCGTPGAAHRRRLRAPDPHLVCRGTAEAA